MPKGQRSYDWDGLKTEWLTTDLSINKFRESKNVESSMFYKKVDIDDWYEARKKIHQKATTQIINQRADILVRKYEDYYKLWNAVKAQAATILRRTQQTDGTIIPLNTSELRNLAESLERALKSERLLEGESTENINNGIDVYNYILKVSANENGTDKGQSSQQALENEQPLQNKIKE